MFAFEFFRWWYGPGWSGVLKTTSRRILGLADMFSVSILLRTLFSPWRRIITFPGASLQDHLRAFGDNLISRFVGFIVRVSVLIAAGVTLALLVLLCFVEIVIWPLVPLGALALIVKGII